MLCPCRHMEGCPSPGYSGPTPAAFSPFAISCVRVRITSVTRSDVLCAEADAKAQTA